MSIGLDHTEILGNTIEKITYEKAGIIKPHKPCVFGPTVPENIINEVCNLMLAIPIKAQMPDGYLTFDEENSIIAETALKTLASYGTEIHPDSFYALSEKQPFRMSQFFINQKKIFLDVSLNPSGIRKVLNDLDFLLDCPKITAVVGMSKGKMIKEYLEIIRPRVEFLYLVSGSSEKLNSIEELLEISKIQPDGTGDIINILQTLLQQDNNNVVLITGSFYIMKEVSAFIDSLKQ